MKILCVDDDRGSLLLVRRTLEKAFPEDQVYAAASGEQAVELIQSQAIDLVITDLVMPGLSGIDVLVEAKRERAATEVIMVTAHSSVESAVLAMQKGARDYLAKPIHGELLIEKVANLRELLHSRRELEDYRYAMAVLEQDAVQSARSVEQRLAEREGQLRSLLAIVERPALPEPEKLERAQALLRRALGQAATGDPSGGAAALSAQEK